MRLQLRQYELDTVQIKAIIFPGVVEKEEIEILPKRYRPDNLSALCAATG